VSVIGSTGAGKTTFGRELARRLKVPFVELDSIYHQANWTPLPDEDFRRAVAGRIAGDSWVVDGNYGVVRPLVLARADTVVWLDYRRTTIMRRVVWRSVIRAVSRTELWNGNREDVRHWLRPDHPIRWAWSQHARKRDEYAERLASPAYGHLCCHRFGTPGAARGWLDGELEAKPSPGPPTLSFMWDTILVLGLLAASIAVYWWLGRIWPETRELQQRMRDERRRIRDVLLRRPGQEEPE
jgi:adenylate kinase family enzyme